nr:hypothetical protein [Citrobacter braakii]WBU75911.1 hypothetical protein PGH06_26240 [Citrobacter braakii]
MLYFEGKSVKQDYQKSFELFKGFEVQPYENVR